MNFKKITKPTARKLFDIGTPIYLIPNKCNIHNDTWVKPTVISKTMGVSFDKIVNEYEYYNCNYEAGKVAAYYVEKTEV